MDYSKWISSKFLRNTQLIVIVGAIISQFFINHTYAGTTIALPLPADKNTAIAIPSAPANTTALTGTIVSLAHSESNKHKVAAKKRVKKPAHHVIHPVPHHPIHHVAHHPIHHPIRHATHHPVHHAVHHPVHHVTRHPVRHVIHHPIRHITHHQPHHAKSTKKVVATHHTATSKNTHLAQQKKAVVTKTLRFKSAVIHRSLSQAEAAAGLTANMDRELNAMFAQEGIARNIRPGDRLEVLYHEYFVNDERNHPGNIVAAEITNGKTRYRVVRFTNPDDHTGYYLPNGVSTKPSFLSVPLHYVRIGSHFSYDRFDPILHRVQPHLGVDFDAPMGTPVKALSNGVVVFRKQIRGYGNTVMIQYNKTYKSFYAHLEKFARNLKPNEHVKKGQVIGYVGMTGWSTGPHLHFAVYKNGVAVNPLTVKFPHTAHVPGEFRHDFYDKTDHWFYEMHMLEAAKMAGKKGKTTHHPA
jgi:murein DD-endopeptidase MepM/ murein hydrolase activator NlpD